MAVLSTSSFAEPAHGSEAALRAGMLALDETWQQRYLPEIERYLGDLERADLAALTSTEFAAHFDTVWDHFARLFALQFLILLPARAAMTAFEETYRELLGGSDLDAHTLLGGLPTKTTACSTALWQLSRLARTVPAVSLVITTEPSGQAVAALQPLGDAADFLTALGEFLHEYGHRSDGTSLSHVSWLEDPTPVIATLKAYLTQPDSADPALAAERAARQCEAGAAAARDRLARYPGQVVEEFTTLLAAAQTGSRLSEENTH